MNQEQTEYWFEVIYPDMFVCKACGAVVPGIEHFPDLHVRFHIDCARVRPFDPGPRIYDQEKESDERQGDTGHDPASPPSGRAEECA